VTGHLRCCAKTVAALAVVTLGAVAADAAGDSVAAAPRHPPLFDHSPWHRIVRTHVDVTGRVAYKSIADAEITLLRAYLESIAGARPEAWPRDDQIAFWLNAYNAGIVSAVLEGQDAESVITRARLFKSWKFRVAGSDRTPDDIENQILRKQFQEPRIHFALVCASVGCPPLRRSAYTADSLTLQLDDQARRFINDPQHNVIDPASRRFELSSIFDWFRADFERASGTVPRYVARYVRDENARQWLLDGAVPTKYLEYDWSLNLQMFQRPERRRPAAKR
jgi:hypothetical protein